MPSVTYPDGPKLEKKKLKKKRQGKPTAKAKVKASTNISGTPAEKVEKPNPDDTPAAPGTSRCSIVKTTRDKRKKILILGDAKIGTELERRAREDPNGEFKYEESRLESEKEYRRAKELTKDCILIIIANFHFEIIK